MNFEEKYRKYKYKYLCESQKGGVKTHVGLPNTTKFDNVTLANTRNKRLINELQKIFEVYNDVVYNENIIEIPSKNIRVTISNKFPFGNLNITFNNISYIANWHTVGSHIVDHINKMLDGDKTGFKMIMSLGIFKDGKSYMKTIVRDDICTMTINQFAEILQDSYDNTTQYISALYFDNNIIYSPTNYYENKTMCDIITSSSLNIIVNIEELLSEDNLINFMKDTENVTTNLSRYKIVSTPETAGNAPSIVYYHLNLYRDNIEYILRNVFGQDGVCVKYSNSKFNPVIFYIDEYLNKFADKLKRLEEFKDIENLPDYLLTQLGYSIQPDNNLYYTLMLILFGDIDRVEMYPSDFIPDKTVLELYREYLGYITQ